jgi:hypothetical protein
LLATANYLHIPSVTSQALLLVLSTIGPWTITRYFGFAIGHGIGQSEGNEPKAAVGLDVIGKPAPPVAPTQPPTQATKTDEVSPQDEEDEDDDLVKVSSLGNSASTGKDRAVSGTSQHTYDTQSVYTEHPDDGEQTYFYGVVGDKIGEACACWLTRWGGDILALEEAVEARLYPPPSSTKFSAPFPKLTHNRASSYPASGPAPATFSTFFASMSLQSASHSTSSLTSPSRRSTTPQLHPFLISPAMAGRPRSGSTSVPTRAPQVWSHGGMPARWARAVMSADNLFVRGEWERFVFMTRVVELRRRQLAREAAEAAKQGEAAVKRIERLRRSEESEWDEMFKAGIYYSHIVSRARILPEWDANRPQSLEDLYRISQEPSSNGKPFVELCTLQSAHWRQSILRSQITSHSIVSNSRSSSPTPGGCSFSTSSTEGELGGLVSTADILASPAPDDTKAYFPIPSDASVRVGHDRTNSLSDADAELDLLSSPSPSSPPTKVRKPASESDLFGLRPSRRTAREIAEEHARGGSEVAKWSTNEPFRFSVEFWGLDTLKEKNRLHSQTVWYAGSLYNVYVQVVKKKGMQLGVYLHRQSAVDPIPPASAPASFVLLNLNNPPTPTESGMGVVAPLPRMGATPPDRDAPVTYPPSAPVAPWRDPRRIVRSYFIMTCPSLIGSSLTRFQSGPDDFKISQSWGWKSSCLWSESEHEEPCADDGWNSLRATVVIGVV